MTIDFHSLADITIYFQYSQFRTPRKNLRQLTLNNCKTILLSESEKKRYMEAINYLNEDWRMNDNNIDENKIHTIGVCKEIHIDIEGFSLEVAEILGYDYLDDYILLSTKQTECGSIRLGRNIDDNFPIRFAINNFRNVINNILIGEILIGNVKKRRLNDILYNSDSLFNIDITFDTPNEALFKLRRIRKEERELLEDYRRMKDREFLKNILSDIEGVSKDHGSIDRIPDKNIHMTHNVDFHKLCIEKIDIYCISKDGERIFIYFSKNEKDKEICQNNNITLLNGKDEKSLNVLLELGVVGYNPFLGMQRAISNIVRKEKDKKEKMEKDKIDKKGDIPSGDFPDEAKELLTSSKFLMENNRSKDCFNCLGRYRIYMVYPLIQNEILYELLSRMENNEYKSYYRDVKKFISKVSDMNDCELGKFLEGVLESLEFNEENNILVNNWLMKNRKSVCDNLGIVFT